MTEGEAVARLRAGDPAGLEALVRLYSLRAVRVAYLIVRDRATAEDVAQGAFLHAYERIDRFDPARPFGPWFLRIVANRATTQAAREARHIPQGGEGEAGAGGLTALADPDPGPEETLLAAETRAEVWAALGRLSPAQRAAIVLRYYADLGEAELATALGCAPGTVKWHLHTARRRLRALLRPS